MNHDISRPHPEIAVVSLHGKLMGGPGTDEFRASALALIAEGISGLILDFKDCEYANSTGIGALVSILFRSRNANVKVRFSNVPARTKAALINIGLIGLLSGTTEEALSGLREDTVS